MNCPICEHEEHPNVECRTAVFDHEEPSTTGKKEPTRVYRICGCLVAVSDRSKVVPTSTELKR